MSHTHRIGYGKYDLHPWWLGFGTIWPKTPGTGKFWKKHMNKARRKFWKLNPEAGIPNNGAESEVNYRTW